ncbi:MAG: LytR C-terminal domain-containing protein [Candidatus Daviesbacteria bacterium]|nr:LytR C-terminal domain-containing protein [Candidatus Daviesbacteria bacterium]
MSNNLPDDSEDTKDDGPVKVSYHVAPGQDRSDDEEDEKKIHKVEESKEDEEDPLDDEDLLDEEESDEESEEEEEEILVEPQPPEEDIIEEPKEELPKNEQERTSTDYAEDKAEDTDSQEKPIGTLYRNIRTTEHINSSDIEPKTYYLQTVKAGEQPEWQVDKEELDVFSQPIGGGLMQYFAYPKELRKTADDIPNAELVASKNKSSNPVIIIDQIQDHLNPGCCLELILSQHGHALAKIESNLDNLEANITSLIDSAKMNFGLSVEHFISTSNVSTEVEKRLDELEDAGGERENPDTLLAEEPVRNASSYNQPLMSPDSQPASTQKGGSKMAVAIPVLILIIMIGLIFFYRENILSIINPPQKQEVAITPTETPTPTPTVAIDRSKYTVRVLNGTPKSGAAGLLADQLKEKGWLIDRTGNATSSAVAQSYVRGKVGIDEIIQTLIKDVSGYETTPSAVILSSTDKADLEFVIGKK